MYFLLGVGLLVAAFVILDLAMGSENGRIRRYPFLDEAIALTITSMIGFGATFLFFGWSRHQDALHVAQLVLALCVILLSIRAVRRRLVRLFVGNTQAKKPVARHRAPTGA